MRYIFVTPNGIVDSQTGETFNIKDLEKALLMKPGGVIAGNNLYPVLANLVTMIRSDEGWSGRLKLQQKRKYKSNTVGGAIYFTHITYRFPKIRKNGKRFRPGSIKWLIINLELFTETEDISGSTKALVDLATRRGIKPRHSPGAFAGALLRSSPKWEKGRNPAPWFISEIARQRLPGNYYALRSGVKHRTVKTAFYMDQKSSHHTIVSSIPIPNPAFLRARGRLRAVEKQNYPKWIDIDNIDVLSNQIGLLCCTIKCNFIPLKYEHLYLPWMRQSGERTVWVWTPEVRLFDWRVELLHISAALTSYKLDPALLEFAEWSLCQLQKYNHPVIKPALLAAYGLLGARSDREIERYSISGRPKPPRAENTRLPLVGDCFRSLVTNTHVPVTQNVVARGVIESETRTRSIEYARYLEWERGIKVNHIYADGLIAECDFAPPTMPTNNWWREIGKLTDVRSSSPNTIVSNEVIKTPGIPSGRRTIKIQPARNVAN